jgi:ATP-binding cassette subfamily B (MDR/TAP) protein 1
MAIAFWRGWDLTLIILAMVPILACVGAAIAIMGSKLTKSANIAYAKANTISQQALGNIRTVAAFNHEEQVVREYSAALEWPLKAGIKQGFMQGCIIGCTNGIFFMSYAAAMYYGAVRVADGTYTGGDVLNVIFAAIIGGFALGQAAPSVQYFLQGRNAGAVLFKMIEKQPEIDLDAPGKELETVTGDLTLQNLYFNYPARPDKPVFQGFNLHIPAGSVTALVGASGSGKSTAVQLIQRFYDPQQGAVLLDGHDLKTLQLRWLRSLMGLVSQEPALFASSIRDNIMYGKPGSTQDEIEAAAKAANAHRFIITLPMGYDTLCGEKGTQLSGGQKQRIAIARAILRNPKILLLDEATSALDTESEKLVQEALDNVKVGRTTVVVAHRLSTIINADAIAVVQQGSIVELGTHDELIKDTVGAYATLIATQQAAMDQGDQQKGGKEEAVEEEAGGLWDSIAAQRRASLDMYKSSTASGDVIAEDAEDLEKGSGKKKEKGNKSVGYWRLAGYNKPEWPYFIVGAFSSACLGMTMPGFALALSSIIAVFYAPVSNPDCAGAAASGCVLSGGAKWALIFMGIGLGCILFGILQGYCFGVMGQKLARRLRVILLKCVLTQDISFFDKKENSSGAIVGRLASDTVFVRGAVGDQVGVLLQNIVTMVGALTIAFIASWSMCLVVLATLPILAFANVFQTKFMIGFSSDADTLYNDANQTAAEAMGSIRTIAAFGMEDQICELYNSGMVGPEKQVQKKSNIAGAGFGFSQFVMFAVYALAFWFGAQEVSKGRMSFDDMLKAFFSILLAAFGLAQAQMAFPDMSKSGAAVQRVFEVIDAKPLIDSSSPTGEKPSVVTGDIELKNVTFAYPSRPDVTVFRKFNLMVNAGQSLALVGESGSGKSTIVGLVLRFYDPLEGAVLLDGKPLPTLNIHWLRSQVGLVNQEPVLFTDSIMGNIKYGNERATVEEVRAAAEAANALEFIDQMPEGLETRVGEGGIQLSGGQKQRIAIARAILRDPRILLLDEATSALDAESEKQVQAALDRIIVGRTCVVVAHRLSTVRNADVIAVVAAGRIIEQGTHDSLMNATGSYSKLVRHQSSRAVRRNGRSFAKLPGTAE